MTHEEFVSRLGPVLAPENYDIIPNTSQSHPISAPPSTPNSHGHHPRKYSGSGPQIYSSSPNGISPPPNMGSLYQQFIIPGLPPFDWMHFEGRSPNTLHANMTGLDGLARERGWRSKCVFSLQISRTGVETVRLLMLRVPARLKQTLFFSSFLSANAARRRNFLFVRSTFIYTHAN